jgi:hypothetical protein
VSNDTASMPAIPDLHPLSTVFHRLTLMRGRRAYARVPA